MQERNELKILAQAAQHAGSRCVELRPGLTSAPAKNLPHDSNKYGCCITGAIRVIVTKSLYLPRQSLLKQLYLISLRRPLQIEELQKVFVGRLLVPKLYGLLQIAHDHALGDFDLTVRQASLLASCDLGEAKTQSDLVRIYGIEASSINRLVDRLVKKSFLHRCRSKVDRRQIFLQITPQGQKCLWDAVPVAAEIAKRAWKGVTEQEKAALASIVNKVAKNVNEMPGPLKHPKKEKGEQ